MYAFSFLLGVYTPGVELLGQMLTPYLNFLKTVRLFANMPLPFYILTSSLLGFWFLHILTNNPLVIVWYLIVTYILVGVKWYSLVILVCISLMTDDFKVFFQVLVGQLYIFLGEMSIQVLCPVFNWVIFLFLILSF